MEKPTAENRLGDIFEQCSQETKCLQWFKVVFVGDCHVGKTSIIKSFCKAEFNSKYTPTVGVDYGFKVVDNSLRVHMWDLSGNSFFRDTRNELYEDTDLCILVYDVTSRQSFESLETYWLPEIRKYDIGDAMIACVGNKRDKLERLDSPLDQVKLSDAETWCLKRGSIRHTQVSAATGDNIQFAMSEFIKLRLKTINTKLSFNQ